MLPGSNVEVRSYRLEAVNTEDVFREAGFEILEARRYGTCGVFNVRIDELKHRVMIDWR